MGRTLYQLLERQVRKLGNPSVLRSVLASKHENIFPLRAADWLRRVYLAVDISEEYRKNFFNSIQEKDLARFLADPPITNTFLKFLSEQKVLPTPEMLQFVQKDEGTAATRIRSVREHITKGGFDSSNIVHKELEYSAHVLTKRRYSEPHHRFTFEEFMALPRIDAPITLDDYAGGYVIATAQEAVDVLERIQDLHSATPDIPLLVIGNARYGADFVVHLVRQELNSLGCTVVREYVSSRKFDISVGVVPEIPYISHPTLELILRNSPNVVVVDGTVHSRVQGMSRIPASMQGYMNWFAHLQKDILYSVVGWCPDITETFLVGTDHRQNPLVVGGARTVTLISSTKGTKESSMAYFDDPENNLKRGRAGFTDTGFEIEERHVPSSKEVSDYVRRVQEACRNEVEKLVYCQDQERVIP